MKYLKFPLNHAEIIATNLKVWGGLCVDVSLFKARSVFHASNTIHIMWQQCVNFSLYNNKKNVRNARFKVLGNGWRWMTSVWQSMVMDWNAYQNFVLWKHTFSSPYICMYVSYRQEQMTLIICSSNILLSVFLKGTMIVF